MNKQQADQWVVISALVVLGVYGYRRLTETPAETASLKSALGVGAPLKLGAFVTAWGFTFLVISGLASASPGLGGSFALLIATADFLGNAPAVLGDVVKQQQPQNLSAAAAAAQSIGATSALQATPPFPLPANPTLPTITSPRPGVFTGPGVGTLGAFP